MVHGLHVHEQERYEPNRIPIEYQPDTLRMNDTTVVACEFLPELVGRGTVNALCLHELTRLPSLYGKPYRYMDIS